MTAVGTGTERRDDVAAAVFSTWIVTGLFLDGWAHNAGMVDTFWTPWHAVLYSGFFAGSAFTAWRAVAAVRAGRRALNDGLVAVGFAVFLVGGLADAAWHTAFGIEEDFEALLSPPHLVLMTAGLILVTTPLRSAWARLGRTPSLRAFLPAAVSATLAVAVVSFFLQFASPFRVRPERFAAAAGDEAQALAVLGMVATTVVLLAVTFLLGRRWQLPGGTLVLVYAGSALLLTGLFAFRDAPLVLAAALGGAAADALHARGARPRALGAAVPALLWSAWFGIAAAEGDLGWPPTLWLGAITMSSLAGFALSLLVDPPQVRGTSGTVEALRCADPRELEHGRAERAVTEAPPTAEPVRVMPT